MLKWLKKFVLDILPSVAATIIGAYVVNHYIIPKSSAGQNQPSIASAISDAITSKMSDATVNKASFDKASFDKASFEKGVADKTAIEKTAEKAAADRAAAADKVGETSSDTAAIEPRKQHPAPKPVARTAAKPVDPAPAPAQDERRAGDLARAVLERLRGTSSDSTKPDPAKVEAVKVEAVKAAETPRIQPVSTVASASPMQPLPPAITVARPNPDVFERGNAAPVMRQPYPQSASRSDESRRFTPPADIPASRPLDLRAEATAPLSDRSSVTDEVLSAAKSMFHAVIPR